LLLVEGRKKRETNLRSFYSGNTIRHLENHNVHCTAVSTNTINLKAILLIYLYIHIMQTYYAYEPCERNTTKEAEIPDPPGTSYVQVVRCAYDSSDSSIGTMPAV
jgi:hypothetical protein